MARRARRSWPSTGLGLLAFVAYLLAVAGVAAADSVTSLTLINADTDQPVPGYNPLPDGATLNLATLPTTHLNIRANTSPATVGSVRFALDGNQNFRTESTAPYALAGDTNGNYNSWTPSLGQHTLTTTPFSQQNGGGIAGTPLTITFTVTNQAPTNQAPVANAGPDQTIVLPNSAALNGSATDDGLPAPPGALTYAWSTVSGPGTVTFGNATAATTTASFSAAGTYTLRLTVSDSALSDPDDVIIVANQAPTNQAPVANAGPDQTIVLPNSAALNGSATDDGLPAPPGALTYAWSTVSGPGTVTFGNATAATTTASFSAAGTYTLRLTVSDSALSDPDDVIIVANQAPTNQAPVANAGPNQKIALANSAALNGSATDDGLPAPPGALTYAWSTVSGPGTVTFGNAAAATTTAFFSAAGKYTLRLTVSDSALSDTDDVIITIQKIQAPTNQAPVANAGPDQTIVLPNSAALNGSATDDGLPAPPGALTYAWSTVSGPGTVTFGNATAATTTASFSAAGTYTLRLTVSDSALSDPDDVIIVANQAPTNQAPVANAGPDQTIVLPNSAALNGSATDDGLPAPPGALTYAWSTVSGPGTVTFGNAAAATTTASFSAAGTYTLRLTVSDSALSDPDDVIIVANQAPTNQAPVANAGPDQTIVLPNSAALNGSATDDGLPAPPGALTYAWSTVSGPGTVTFGNATAATTTASFSAAGPYTLRLTVSDSALSDPDDVIITVTSAGGGGGTQVRINSGGAAYTDTLGRAWVADGNFSGGTTFSTTQAISGTEDETLYKTERWGNFSYAIPVANGTYEVVLHFAELYFNAAGMRVFDVFAEGQLVIDNLDIFAQVGQYAAHPVVIGTAVTDGVLNLSFVSVVNNAKVSAIEVRPPSGTNQTPVANAGPDQTIVLPNSVALNGSATDDGLPAPPGALTYAWSTVSGPGTVTFGNATAATTTASFSAAGPYTLRLTVSDSALSDPDDVIITVTSAGGGGGTQVRINSGGAAYTDTLGRAWVADGNFSGGTTFSTTQAISGTEDETLYKTERWGNFSYAIPVANGTYEVVLHFAELYFNAAGMRVFDVFAEGQLVIDNLDIFAQVGQYAAHPVVIGTAVTDGVLNLSFVSVVNNAKVSAIEVRPPSGTNQTPVANAGPDQTIVLPNSVALNGSATDDGLPAPPGALTYAWSTVSGPGTVTFGNAAAATTTASFSAAGPYTLRLTVSDSALSDPDDVIITVTSAGGGGGTQVRINSGGAAYTDTLGRAWVADGNFSGGTTFSTTQAISGTEDDTLYKTERFGNFSYAIPVVNGTYEVVLHFAELYFNAAGMRVFDVFAEGQLVIDNLDIFAQVGQYAAHPVVIGTAVTDGVLNLSFVSVVNNAKVSAIEVRPHPGDPFLHVVIDTPPPSWIVDYNGNGSEPVPLVGSHSHTHQLGHKLTAWTWTEGSTTLGTTPDITPVLAVGSHTITLTIADDNTPPATLSDSVQIQVFPIDAVGGVSTSYYPANGTPLTTLIDALPAAPGFVEVRPTLRIEAVGGKVGGSPFVGDVVAAMVGTFQVTTGGTYQFVLTGGVARRLVLNGTPVTGPVTLAVGSYDLEARFAVDATASLPAEVLASLNGGTAAPIAAGKLSHDETNLVPFINSMPASGSPLGDETVLIHGVGFFPAGSVVVHWGGIDLGSAQITAQPGEITLVTPPGSGTISVTVETPNGVSNSVSFTYTTGTVPIAFASPQTIASVAAPTQAAWGPDRRLYVVTESGTIKIYTVDDNYVVTATQTVNTIAGLSNNNSLGIAFNPFDPPSPVRVYIAHSQLFANGGSCFSGPSAYTGQVSVLEGPTFSVATPLLTGLPVSNHDHGVNGLVFDNQGDLWIAQGGNTNAGVEDCDIGDLPESPLSAGVLKARTSKPPFNGVVEYVESGSGVPNNDQVFGGSVDVAPGVDVSVFASGLRNPFDLVLTTTGKLYGTDNGPNAGYGAASTSATTQGPDPTAPDEVVRLVEGHYYGHPNRNRGRYSNRENVYRSPTVGPILGQYTAPLATVPSSSDGIDEYRATTFNSAMRGHLLVQQLNGALRGVKLTPTGTDVESVVTISPGPPALDVLAGPGGVILGIDHGSNSITVSKPNDAGAIGMIAYDIFPWRATAGGGTPFTIGGVGFGSLATTTVTIGGLPAALTSVSATRIKGVIPADPSPTAALLDVVVESNGQQSGIPAAFRYVLPPTEGTGVWSSAPPAPTALGEVAGGIINGVLYVVGNSSSATLAFDLATETWLSNLAVRPFVGDHHAAEVINGELYLFGGLGGNSGDKVQIYDPATNSWSLGAAMPFATGSASTALIDGLVYLAGGIVGSSTVTTAAVYDPGTNLWSMIPPMPLGRNHTAAGTDGAKLYIFGGRGPGSGDGNVVAVGFDDVQIYDPETGTWACSCHPGSPLPPLPQKRGGMGKAAFYGGEFYVIGGETTSQGTGQVAGNVYNRVDVFDPATQSWRLETLLPTARHGIFPLVYDGRVFVAGGGTQAGSSSSKVLELFAR